MIYRSIHCAMRIKKYENLSKKAKLEMINKEIAEESKKKKKRDDGMKQVLQSITVDAASRNTDLSVNTRTMKQDDEIALQK